MCKKTSRTCVTAYLKFHSKAAGFSLIELLLTLVLFGILLSLAFPAYHYFIVEIRVLTLTERILSAINTARSEAIKRHERVIICKSVNEKACVGKWSDGWIMYVGKYTVNPSAENVLRVYPRLNKKEFLQWHGAGGRDYLRLNPDGSASGFNGSFVVCVSAFSATAVRVIKVSQTGRVRVDKKQGRHPC